MAQPLMQHTEILDINKGLSNNDATCIIQDQEGFLWIGTQNGLNRYDGSKFKHYFSEEGKNLLSDNTIYNIISIDSSHFLLGFSC